MRSVRAARSNRCRARPRLLRAPPPGAPVFGELHQVACRRSRSSASSSAPRPSRSCPSNGTRWSSSRPRLSCTCVVIRCSGGGLDRRRRRRPSGARGRSPCRCRRARTSRSPSSIVDERRRRRRARSGSPRAPRARRAARPARQISSTLRDAAAAAVVARRLRCAAGVPRCTTSTSNGIAPAICSAASASRTAACAPRVVRRRVRERSAPRSPLVEAGR